jgi:hypothetical protein
VAGLYKQAFRFDGDDLLLARSSPGGGPGVTQKSPLNVLKDTYDHSFY